MNELPDIKSYYVSNGAFICAAHFMGFTIERDTPNAHINYSQRSPIIQWRKLKDERGKSIKQMQKLDELEKALGLPSSIPADYREMFL